MSRSNPTLTNPGKKFFRWSGSKGVLTYWDKEKEAELAVQDQFTFMVLDQLATITGYCEEDASGYWSNEVRSILKDELTVRTSKGTKYVGNYKNNQGMVQIPRGARYATSIYVAYEENGQYVIGNIKATGAALTAWIEFGKKFNVMRGKVRVTGSEEAQKGATKYFVPVFQWIPATDEENEAAVKLDQELQTYLTQYLSAAKFDREAEAEKEQDVVIEDIGDEPINLDEIPF